MGAGVAVAAEHVLTAHYLVLGASTRRGGGPRRQAARRVGRVSLDHESGLALLDRGGRRLRAGAARAASDELRPGDPVFLLTCTGEKERRGASGHVSFVGPVRGVLGVHAGPRDHDHDRQPRPRRRAAARRARPRRSASSRSASPPVGRYSLAIPIEPLPRAARSGWRARRPCPTRSAAPGSASTRRRATAAIAISGVVPGGPAEAAGLQRGDLLVSVDGARRSRTCAQLYRALWRKGPGDSRRHAGAARRVASRSSRSWRATATSSTSRRPMSILKVARIGHPVLRAPAKPVPKEAFRDPLFQKLVDDMRETMYEYEGVGLAGAAGPRGPAPRRDRGARPPTSARAPRCRSSSS